MALLVSVLAIAAATGAHLASRDPNWVSNTIDDIDTDCTQARCGSALSECKEAGHICSKRISCAFDADKPKECWAGVKWSELHPHELKVFNCATSKGCIPSSPSASLLQTAQAAGEAAVYEDHAEHESQLRNEHGATRTSQLNEKELKRRTNEKAHLLERLAAVQQRLGAHADKILDHAAKMDAMKEMLANLKARSHAVSAPSAASLHELEDVQAQLHALQEHLEQ